MRSAWAHKLLLTVLPAMVIASVAVSTVWGRNGLVTRSHLHGDLADVAGRLEAIDRENQRLLRDLRVMEQDPLALERVAAEEIAWGRKGTVIWRFED